MAKLRKPANATYDLVYKLRKTSKSRWRVQRRVDLIQEIAACNDALILPYLVSELFGKPAVVRATIQAINHLVGGVSAAQLPQLSENMRSWVGDRSDWNELQPTHLVRFKEIGEPQLPFWGLLSFHGNGHIRQAALGWLDGFETGEEIPFLLLRANDWVLQVRRRAADILSARLTSRFVDIFARNIALIVRLEASRRAGTSDLIGAIHQLLRSEVGVDVLLAQLESESHKAARAALRIAVMEDGPVTIAAIRRALEQTDVVLRTHAIEAAAYYLEGNELAILLAKHRHDPHRLVRKRVMETFVQKFPEQAKTPLSNAIFDSSRSIRQYARYHLEQMGEVGFLNAYRQVAQNNKTRLCHAGLRGLADIGTPEDAKLILPHLTSSSSKNRRLAIRALGDIAPTDHLERFMIALEDEVPRNCRAAADILSEHLDKISLDRLLKIYTRTSFHHTQAIILRIFDNLDFWSRLEYLLRAATVIYDDDPHPDLTERIARYLTHWASRVNYVYTTPSPSQRESVDASLGAVSADFPSGLVGVIREILERKGSS